VGVFVGDFFAFAFADRLTADALAAFWALSRRCSGVSFFALAWPPFLPIREK